MTRLWKSALWMFVLIGFVSAQDNRSVLDALMKVEANLLKLIEQEKTARQAENAQIMAKLNQLTGAKSDVQKAEPSRHEMDKKKEHEKQNEFGSLIRRLQEGNLRYVKNAPAPKNMKVLRNALVKGQKPFVTVLTCSDSRVPPEMIFDETLGQIFVVRVAGNIADSSGIGSIEYAAEHLHTGLLLVLGHESCGAVKATVEGGAVPPNIGSLVWKLQPAVAAAKEKGVKEKELVSFAVEENVGLQIASILKQSTVLGKMVEEGEVKVIGGVYDLETGSVRFLDTKETAVR